MRRRDFLTFAGGAGASLAVGHIALAQQAKLPRLAFLSLASQDRVDALHGGLADYGYIDGKNIAIELFIAPATEQTQAFAERAVGSNPDVIVVGTTAAAQFAKGLTSSIPIIMDGLNDPLGNGFVASLAHPGGNITG